VSAGRWLAERNTQPPADLAAAIALAISNAEDRASRRRDEHSDTPSVTEHLIVAAERLLPRVVFAECQKRSGALDLLTLDSLITYAMESASSTQAECEAAATALLDAIGAASEVK